MTVMLLGCVDGSPSNGDVKEAVLKSTLKYSKYNWVQEVEVIAIGRPYTLNSIVGEFKYYPVKVYLIGNERRQEGRVEVYQDEFGEWKAGLPYSLR
ncbi:hypothetical protein ACFLUS_02905 [Chloroflexota bacterium]